MKYLIGTLQVVAFIGMFACGVVFEESPSAGFFMAIGSYAVWSLCQTYNHLKYANKQHDKVMELLDEKYDLRMRLLQLGDYAWMYARDYEQLYGKQPSGEEFVVVPAKESAENYS